MRSGRFEGIGLLLSTNANRSHIPAGLLDGIYAGLVSRDMHLTLSPMPDEKLNSGEVPKIVRQRIVDGLLINYTDHVPPSLIELIAVHRIPSIWLNTHRPNDAIRPDDYNAAQRATGELLAFGHRRISYVDYHNAHNDADLHYSVLDRYQGYADAMIAAAQQPRAIWERDALDPQDRIGKAARWLGQSNRPSAVVCYSPWTSLPVLLAAATVCQLRVPADLSIVTFSDQVFQDIGISMATMLLPEQDLGRQAVEMLMEKIDEPQVSLPTRVLPFTLEPGETMAPPPPDIRPREQRGDFGNARRRRTPDGERRHRPAALAPRDSTSSEIQCGERRETCAAPAGSSDPSPIDLRRPPPRALGIRWRATRNAAGRGGRQAHRLGSRICQPRRRLGRASLGSRKHRGAGPEAHSGKRAIMLRGKGREWIGGGWNWVGWYPANGGTDITPYKNLSFWLKARIDGDSATSVSVSLNCSSTKKQSGQADVIAYEPSALDGGWHEIVIPLADLYDDRSEFDPTAAWELDIDTWSRGERSIQVLIDDLGFDRRDVRSHKLLASLPEMRRNVRPLKLNVIDVSATVDLDSQGTPISPYIYGAAMGLRDVAQDAGLTILRAGGNPLTPHDWKTGFSSKGADWFFENDGEATTPDKDWLVNFHAGNKKASLESYLSIPIMGRVAKDGKSYAFDILKYPGQESWAGKVQPRDRSPNAGNGRRIQGKDGKGKRSSNSSSPTRTTPRSRSR